MSRPPRSFGPIFVATILSLAGSNVIGTLDAAAQRASTSTSGSSAFHPTVADLMNALIQPRHAKLGLAGAAGNWPLAAYALFELKQGFKSVGETWPMWRRLSLPDMIDNVITGPAESLDRAIEARDPAQFASAYRDLTKACNSCHSALHHEFIVIKVPDRSTFPNQSFAPAKE